MFWKLGLHFGLVAVGVHFGRHARKGPQHVSLARTSWQVGLAGRVAFSADGLSGRAPLRANKHEKVRAQVIKDLLLFESVLKNRQTNKAFLVVM